MPVNCDSVLQGMVDKAPQQSESMDKQIDQIDEQIADLEEQAAAVRECVTDVAKADLLEYMGTTKLAEIQALWPPVPLLWGDVYFVTYGDFGTIGYGTGNINEWEFRQEDISLVPTPPGYRVVYSHTDNWDGDTTITGFEGDYDFGNDYLTHPVGIGAAYGLEPLADMYDQGKQTILGNKAKIEASVDILKKYVGL